MNRKDHKKVRDKKIKQEHILELAKEFDVTFDTEVAVKINTSTTSIIKDLFIEYVENIYSPSDEYKKIGKVAKDKRAKLEETMTSAQKEMLEDLFETENQRSDEIVEQSFVYGFCLANQLIDEIGHIYNIKRKDNVS